MSDATGRASPTRFALISLVMLAVLLCGIAVAWWMVHRHPATRGTRVLAEIRKDGLGAYYAAPTETWLLTRQRGNRYVGWQVSFTRAEQGGQFQGLNVQAVGIPNGRTSITWEHWAADGKAQWGQYSAGRMLASGPRWLIAPDTTIDLDKGRLKVVQAQISQRISSAGAAPENYIPEGLTPLVVLLVARGSDRVQFKIILNSQPPPPDDPEPRFFDLVAGPVKPPANVPGAAAAASTAILVQGKPRTEDTYVFNEAGKLIAVLGKEDTDEVAATWATVRGEFPSAPEYIRVLGERLKFPLPSHVAPSDSPASGPATRSVTRRSAGETRSKLRR